MNSKEKLFMVRLFVRETFFVILDSAIAITSKVLFVQLKKSSKFLFREHAFIGNKASELSFIVCN